MESLQLTYDMVQREKTQTAVEAILRRQLGCAWCALRDTCCLLNQPVGLITDAVLEQEGNVHMDWVDSKKKKQLCDEEINAILKEEKIEENCQYLRKRYKEVSSV